MGKLSEILVFGLRFMILLLIIQINLMFVLDWGLELIIIADIVNRLALVNLLLSGILLITFIVESMFNEKK